MEGLLAKLFPLVESAGFGSRPSMPDAGLSIDPDSNDISPSQIANGKAKPRTRAVVRRPPSGQSCAARILSLRQEGYFQEKRTTPEIVEKLAEKRQTHNVSQVSAAAGTLVKKGALQRIRDASGSWLYFWDWE